MEFGFAKNKNELLKMFKKMEQRIIALEMSLALLKVKFDEHALEHSYAEANKEIEEACGKEAEEIFDEVFVSGIGRN